jgi:hypothetical protein
VTLAGGIPTSPALWDADGDGDLEIVVASEEPHIGFPTYWTTHQYLIDNAGAVLPGWPVSYGSTFFEERPGEGPVAWGVDREGYLALGTSRGACRVLDYRGDHPDGFAMSVAPPITGTAAVGDLDADLHMEMVVAGNGKIACYDLLKESYKPEMLQWPMFHHDMHRTGVYGHGSVTGVETPPSASVVTRTVLYPAYPNPFNPRVTIPFALAEAGDVRIAVYDLVGRRVRVLLDEKRDTGLDAVVWDGTDAAGRRVGAGVYLVRLKAGEDLDVERVTLVK